MSGQVPLVDVALPGGATVAVEVGQRVVAGETIIARVAPQSPSPAGTEVTDESALH